MRWLRRIVELLSSGQEASEEPSRRSVERAAPGIAALLAEVDERGDHAVLDLGAAVGSNLDVYHRYAGRVRFADLLAVRSESGMSGALEALPTRPERPFDLIFTWNTLDRLRPRERSRLVERLTEISAPGARLHAVVESSDSAERGPPLRFSLVDRDRMRCEPAEEIPPGGPRLLPADVEELLAPFRVVRGFTLKGGLREYVAVRDGR